jgi:hypothetical protein
MLYYVYTDVFKLFSDTRARLYKQECNIDWKYYMKYVLETLQLKVLGEEEFSKAHVAQLFRGYNFPLS